MGSFLSHDDLQHLMGAESLPASPVPTRMVSNGEFTPRPQTDEQRAVERRMAELADRYGVRWGMDRRTFLKTASGFALAFLAMNDVYGMVFAVDEEEAADPDAAAARRLRDQFVFDAQVHFVRDDCKPGSNPHNMLGIRRFAAMLNEDLREREAVIDDLQFQNFVKEVYLDSDTDLAILSGAPSDDAPNWFLSNDQMARARKVVNDLCGSRRLLAHAVITPGQPGWLEEMDRAIDELRPDSWKGYTMGDPNGPSQYRWRLDDEDLVYPAFQKMVDAGITNLCLHKGLLPADAEARMPGVTRFADVSDVGKAAQDWPQINFIVYHCGYNVLMATAAQRKAFEETGQIDWVSDLARIPEGFGVDNVYAEVGSSFGLAAVMNPRFCAGMMGTLIRDMGHERVFWGTDSVWYGSPQWQIEALRRMEIPEDLQRSHGFAPLGPAEGPVKSAILGGNSARHYGIEVESARAAFAADRLSAVKAEYLAAGVERSDVAYGFIPRSL